jgi:RNA exonuclease 1
MDLALLKIKHGPAFGTGESANVDKLCDVLHDAGARCCLVDRRNIIGQFAVGNASAICTASDAETAGAAAKAAAGGSYRFAWAQLHELTDFFYRRAKVGRAGDDAAAAAHRAASGDAAAIAAATPPASATAAGASARAAAAAAAAAGEPRSPEAAVACGVPEALADIADPAAAAAATGAAPPTPEAPPEDFSEARLDGLLRAMDSHVGRIWAALPRNALLLVATGHGDTGEGARQLGLRTRRMNGLDGLPAWSTEDEDAYAAAAEATLQGLAFAAVKP